MIYIPYLSIYVLVNLFGILLLGSKGKLQKVIFFFIIVILLVGYASSRHYVGPDYSNYVEAYRTVVMYDLSQSFDYQIFVLFSKLGSLIDESKGYIFVFLMYSLITVFYFVKSVMRCSINPHLSLIIFLCFGFYLDSFDRVRQMAAIAVVFYAFVELNSGNSRKSILYIILASFFHISSLICLPIVLLKKVKVNRYILVGVLILATMIGYFGGFAPILIKGLSYIPFYNYSSNELFIDTLVVQKSGVLYFSKAIIVSAIIYLNRNNDLVNIWLFIAGIIIVIGAGNILFYRMAMYFLVPIILTPNWIKISLDKGYYLIVILMLNLYCFLIYLFEMQRNHFEYLTWF